jgi:uncharacterized protein
VKQQIKTFVAGGLLALALFGVAMAGPLEDGQAAYQKGGYATALQIFRPLAEHGNASAQSHLGLMHAGGQGVAQDYAQAVAWYRKAADQGDADTQNNLGLAYDKGQGVAQDYAQTVAWYRKAADQGNAVAQYNLGVAYDKGKGVAQDYVRAHMWFNLAASGASDAPDRDVMVKKRDDVAAKMTPDQIAEAQRMAREWMQKDRSPRLSRRPL